MSLCSFRHYQWIYTIMFGRSKVVTKETVAVDIKDLRLLRELFNKNESYIMEFTGALTAFLDKYDKISLDGRKNTEDNATKG